MRIGLTQARLEHELRGHHHQGHMPMPRLPLPGLVLRHPDMALGILERSLDPEALCLHLRQFRRARLSWGVALAVFDGAGGVYFASDDQMPTLSSRTLLVPQPYPAMQHLNDQCSLGRVS